MSETKRPFSNGYEFDVWTERNCEGCAKAYDEERMRFRCEIDEALTVAACDDGLVPVAIWRRMGGPENEGALGWPCPEKVAV